MADAYPQIQTEEAPRGVDRPVTPGEIPKLIQKLEADMMEAAKQLDFETAASLRDEIRELQRLELGV